MYAANRPPAIICDVDGTLCDVRSIRHHVERPEGAKRFRPNFALFHSSSEDCPAFPNVLQLITELEREGYAIVVVTAREARWSELTERWLDRHGVRRAELITRRALDYRSDALIKAEICTEIQGRYAPRLAIDDRDDILAVWAAASIPTVKVDEAGFPLQVTGLGGATDDRLRTVVERVSQRTGTDA
ncbi:HAD family acid phosphatase [Occultella kanbiaonis]|uniref:phosphatase domain-containing protein n=1 Tax=Occultella kanbiaonis TaxID=2675754 RepID=UPI0013D7A043|nr:HAD family acid phosphatase [Occultella kanbiaonis]